VSGTVNWSAYPGELLETAMAVLLLQERPTSFHRVPSQGDGGVDVGEPMDNGDRYRVFQIKRFHDRLTPKQKGQIQHSLDVVIEDPRLDKPIGEWLLVLPLNLTDTEEQWFKDITNEAPFPCDWRGKNFWDSEAAKYSYVIDYFFRDGKERLLERVKTLTTLLQDPEVPPRPGDVAEALRRLHEELNKVDPYFRYEFHVTGNVPADHSVEPGFVMRTTKGFEGVGFVTVDVFARFPQALQDRPVGGSFTVVVRDPTIGVDLTDDLKAWVKYGRRLDVPAGALMDLQVDAPGGLGVAGVSGGAATIGPLLLPDPPADKILLDVVDTGGSPIASVSINITSVSMGAQGHGFEFLGTESEKAFDFQLRMDRPEDGSALFNANWGIRQRELAGLPAASVLPAVHFITQACAPNRLRMTLKKGPAPVASAECELDPARLDFDELSLVVAEQLAALQPHTPVPVLVPTVVSASELEEVRLALRLVEGETVDLGAAKIELVIPRDQLSIIQGTVDTGRPFASITPLTLELQGQRLPLGTSRALMTSPKLESVIERDADSLAVVVLTEETLEELISRAV
jgi:hypothetical protein